MRIAVVYSFREKTGGIETYLDTVIPELVRAGHTLSYWFEIASNSKLEQISLPAGVPAWCVEEMGAERALATLGEWRPDLIYSHGLIDPLLEAEVLDIAPAVIFVHGYYGTCISGIKAFKRPVDMPCDNRFGWRCLLNYYPRGCGGWSPVTMMTEYNRQSLRLKSLRRYMAVVTGSEHMRAEFVRNGINPERVFNTSLPVISLSDQKNGRHGLTPPVDLKTTQTWNLLFLGRMVRLKGAHVFIDALTEVAKVLDQPLHVTFAGDGVERQELERRAAQVQGPKLKIEFVGWVDHSRRDALLETCDLLVVPSIWPEPFGLVGPEAGQFGVPVAAFDVGGVHEWLSDGVNGYLASGNPPNASGLAHAITNCLGDPVTYARLRAGAFELAQQFSMKNHLTALLEVFANVVLPNKPASFSVSST